jgi:hypothetical protein
MTPGRAASFALLSPGWRGLRRAQPVQLGQDGGGLAFVAPAEIGVIGVRDVAGAVLELELAQRRQRRALLLGELLAAIDRQRQERFARARRRAIGARG